MRTSRKRRKLLVLGGIAFVVVVLGIAATLKKREPLLTIQTEKVARRNITELVLANGKIQPVVQVKISPEVSGEIIELPVKEGQQVKKGDLILKIKPDFYIANRRQAEAAYNSSIAGRETAEANLRKAQLEFKRNEELFNRKLISESAFLEFKTAHEIAGAQLTSATHQVAMSKASLARADEELAKTTIVSPLDGTISKLNSQLGERVVGTATMAGTDVMIIADLNEMEARVDIGETDVVLIEPDQHVRLEVDAFRDRKFSGIVTEIGNSSKTAGMNMQQEATKFEVRIRIQEKESFRPGMSVTAEIETRARTNVLTVPIASVTTRMPKAPASPKKEGGLKASARTNAAPESTSSPAATNSPGRIAREKEIQVVFIRDGEFARMIPVEIGIGDDSYWEITSGLKEGDEVVSGPYRAIGRDLQDGKRVRKGFPGKKEKDGEDKDR